MSQARWVVDAISGTYELYLTSLGGPTTLNPATGMVSCAGRDEVTLTASAYGRILADCAEWARQVAAVVGSMPAGPMACSCDCEIAADGNTKVKVKLGDGLKLVYHFDGAHQVVLKARTPLSLTWREWRRLVWVLRHELDAYLSRLRSP